MAAVDTRQHKEILHPDATRLKRGKLLQEIKKGAVVVFHRSWLNELPLIVMIVFITLFCSYIALYFPSTNVTLSFTALWPGLHITIAPLMVVPITMFGKLLHLLLDDRYLLTDDKLVAISGLFSFRATSNQVHFAHIRGIEIDRTLLQRLLGTGNILVGTASISDHEVVIEGIRNPEYYQSIIEAKIKKSIRHTSSGVHSGAVASIAD